MIKSVVIEIGLEELPARFVDGAEQELLKRTKEWLASLRISYKDVFSYSTPRRLAVRIWGIAPEQTTISEEAKGPAVKIAKDAEGNWSKAAIGFAKGQGHTVDDLYIKAIKDVEYVFVNKHIEGKATETLLPSFKAVIESIPFGKNMRWGTETLRYARPIRWITAIYGKEVIPFEIANVKTSNISYGHRFLGGKIELEKPCDYEAKLPENFVIVNALEREALIKKQIDEIAEKENLKVVVDEKLLAEVRNLVEYPTAFIGSFNVDYLKLPEEVLITSMKEHQRYFPVRSKSGKLEPYFVGVRNGNSDGIEIVRKGNEKVLHARLSDAEFFFDEDKKNSIDFYLEKLSKVVFQTKLGTIEDKVNRVIHLTESLSKTIGLNEADTNKAIRVAEICKFDLMTNMVNEFTELQGVMGETYASYFGEDTVVAKGIREHYLPNSAKGVLPESEVSAVVSIADKLDTIIGCIYVGIIPTGSQDPYGLRRQAIGILRILEAMEWQITVESLVDLTLEMYGTLDIEGNDSIETKVALRDFFQMRVAYLLKEINIEQDVIQAVTHQEIGNFAYTVKKALVLATKRNDPDYKQIEEALCRILNLAKEKQEKTVDIALLETASEQALYDAYVKVRPQFTILNEQEEAEQAIDLLGTLADSIDAFFENNMVMAEDLELRENRLALVNNIAVLIYNYADLSLIEWKQQFNDN